MTYWVIVLNSIQDEDQISGGMSSAPVIWKYYGDVIPLQFNAGFIGATQDQKTLQISPAVGWYITLDKSDKKDTREEEYYEDDDEDDEDEEDDYNYDQ